MDEASVRLRLHSISWVATPMLLSFFGACCSLLSRVVQLDVGTAPLWTVMLGIAAAYVIGVPLCSVEIKIPKQNVLAIQGTVAFVVLGIVFVRLVVGASVEFAFIHILLSVGMCYQVVTWVLLTKAALDRGFVRPVAYLFGLVLCVAHAVLGELGARVVMAAATVGGSPLVWGMALLMLATILLALYAAAAYLPRTATCSAAAGKVAAEKITRALDEFDLTERERDVLTLLVSGASLKDIAQCTGVSEGTVKTHLSHAYRKLGVSNRREATSMLCGVSDHEGNGADA